MNDGLLFVYPLTVTQAVLSDRLQRGTVGFAGAGRQKRSSLQKVLWEKVFNRITLRLCACVSWVCHEGREHLIRVNQGSIPSIGGAALEGHEMLVQLLCLVRKLTGACPLVAVKRLSHGDSVIFCFVF